MPNWGVVLALSVALAGCVSLAPEKTPVVLEAPVVAPGLDPALGPKVREALASVLAGSPQFAAIDGSVQGASRGLTEIDSDATGAFVAIRFQIVDPSGNLVSEFSATVEPQNALWAWTFQNRWNSASVRAGAAPATVAGLLSVPQGSKRDEALLEVRFLDRVREGSPWADVALDAEVATAYRTRFGRDLSAALERPSLVFVEGGNGYLGNEQGEADEGPLHSVTVPAFLMAQTEVTQALFKAVTGSNPSLFSQPSDAPRRPVERVSWYDAVEFCNLLSAREGLDPVYTIKSRNPAKGFPIRSAEVSQDRTKSGYRLPTEAEWEWAARGGVKSQNQALAGGGDPTLVAWAGGGEAGPGPVAEKAPNELGLFDMSGNVWEWCSDWYGRYEGDGNDPEGPAAGVMKVGRGGSWHAAPWMTRVTARSFDTPGSRSSNLGFRVVRSLP